MTIIVPKAWLYAVALPACLIISQVFVDVAHGTLGSAGRAGLLSVGVVFRGLLVVLAVVVLMRMRAAPLKAFLLVFLAVFLASNLVWATASDVYSFGHELNQAMRVAFPWLVAGILLYLHQQAPIERFYLLKVLAWVGFLTALTVIGSTALGVGQQTYGDWSYGSKGLFSAQNDLGLTLLLTLVAAIVILARTRKLLYLVVTASIAMAGLVLGTRTGVLGLVVVAVGLLLAALLNRRLFAPSSGRKSLRATAVLVLPVLLAVAVAGVIFSQVEKTTYLLKRIESLSEATPRSKLEAAGMTRLRERDAVLTLVGEGGLAFKKHVAENIGYERQRSDKSSIFALGDSKKLSFSLHRVENDAIDILGFYGIAQFTVIYGALAIAYLLAVRTAIRAWNLENVALLMILTLFLGHSTLAGHGIFSAQVATVLAPVLFLQIRDLQWRKVDEVAAPAVHGSRTQQGPHL